MALHFNAVEAVGFGDLKVKPQMTRELELRVKNLQITENNLSEAIDTLSSCFGAQAMEVKQFMQENMHEYDLVELSVYLLHGDSGLNNLRNVMQRTMNKHMEEATNKLDGRND